VDNIVDSDDVGVVQGGSRLSLLDESAAVFRIGGHAVRQDLYGNEPIRARVEGLIHLAHATAAEFFAELILQNGSIDHEARDNGVFTVTCRLFQIYIVSSAGIARGFSATRRNRARAANPLRTTERAVNYKRPGSVTSIARGSNRPHLLVLSHGQTADIASRELLAPDVHPQVEHVMQVNVREQRRSH
jgi:hypothetical protein